MLIIKKNVFLSFFLLLSYCTFAQVELDYTPKETYDELSFPLIRSLTIQGAQQILLLDKEEEDLAEYFGLNTQELIALVKDRKIIKDDSLKSYLHEIIKKITANNDVITPRKVLVLKSTKTNAYSLGDGTLIICNGLLAKMDSEEELAFILAHEIAHWQLSHFKKKIKKNIAANELYNPEEEFKSVKKGTYSLESIHNIKSWHYNRQSFSREVELEADSLGLILFLNAYKNPYSAILALHHLDSGLIQSPYLGPQIFSELNFANYPFKKEWALVTQSGHVDLSNYNSFDPDSSRTHPVLESRVSLLRTYVNEGSIQDSLSVDSTYLTIKTNAEFENVGCAMNNGNIDQALYLALRLKHRYPKNAYLVKMIGNIFLTMYDLKEDDIHIKYKSDTTGYNNEQQYVYNFIHNIRRSELLELAFYFINQKENFNRTNEDHYYILFEICRLSNRRKMQYVVRENYRKDFKEGKYTLVMD